MLTSKQKRYAKKRRAEMRARGICVDCQKNPIKPPESSSAAGSGGAKKLRPHSCCETCLQARRTRWHEGTMPPLFRAIARSEQVH